MSKLSRRRTKLGSPVALDDSRLVVGADEGDATDKECLGFVVGLDSVRVVVGTDTGVVVKGDKLGVCCCLG